MSEFYPIVTVEPEWVLGGEDMGSKEKFWYRDTAGLNKNCLFKYSRRDTGEHWAEKIAAEVAACLGTLHAKVELAEFMGERGSATESFADGLGVLAHGSATESFDHDDCVLIHGNELLAILISDYNPRKKFRQSAHTLDNILAALDCVFTNSEDSVRAIRLLAEYLVLDAVIGNTDRHHENWGLQLRKQGEKDGYISLAPSFDHASSLGRELRGERRDRLMAEDRVGRYAEKGHGGIYWSPDERRGPSPIELVRRAASTYLDLFRPALAKLNRLDEGSLRNIIDRVPSAWMSPSARKFALALMRYNLEQLRRLDP